MTVVFLTLTATLLIQLGYFLWKLSADSAQPKIGRAPVWEVARSLVSDWRWMTGFAATSVGWVLFVQATALGDISLVQPLMSSGDLLLVVMAVAFLHERLIAMEWGGVLLTIIGAAVLALEANSTAAPVYSSVRLAVLMGILLFMVSVLLLSNRKSSRPEIILALVVGMCFGAGAALTKALSSGHSTPGEMVNSWAILIDPLLLSVVLANVAGLVLLQAAFQRGRAAVIVPLQLAMANVVTVVAGVMVFAEQISVLRGSGIALILAGTALLHLKPHKAY